jgi:hypothetical protein
MRFGNLVLAQHGRQPNGQFRIDQVQLLEWPAQHFAVGEPKACLDSLSLIYKDAMKRRPARTPALQTSHAYKATHNTPTRKETVNTYASSSTCSKGRKWSDSSRAREASHRQCAYVKGVLSGKSKKQAALDAGYSRSTAENAWRKIESKASVQVLFRERLENTGVTDRFLARRIKEGLDATKLIHASRYDGEIVVPDYRQRLRMVELVCRLKGYLP